MRRSDGCIVHIGRGSEYERDVPYGALADALAISGSPPIRAAGKARNRGRERAVVAAPHWMDEAKPELVADAVREVIGLDS